MTARVQRSIISLPELTDRVRVFRDRAHAGQVLGEMLAAYRDSEAIVMAIPAGGVPVGAALARYLHLGVDLAIVSKITMPWNAEAGYGAVAFDGTVLLNEDLLPHLGLSDEQIQAGIRATTLKVTRRLETLRGHRPLPDFERLTAIVVDDGLASGITMKVTVEALRRAGARRVIVAVPTGHPGALNRVSPLVGAVYCANVRHGYSFAVAEAYQHWHDVPESEVAEILLELSEQD